MTVKSFLRSVLAIAAGIVLGSLFNGLLIYSSPTIIPPPEGVDVTSAEGLKAGLHLFTPKHFLMPFLAHSVGTFVGAFTAAYLAPKYHFKYALFIGIFFLFGGMVNAVILPAPLWFMVADLVLAYIPFAYLAGRWAVNLRERRQMR